MTVWKRLLLCVLIASVDADLRTGCERRDLSAQVDVVGLHVEGAPRQAGEPRQQRLG